MSQKILFPFLFLSVIFSAAKLYPSYLVTAEELQSIENESSTLRSQLTASKKQAEKLRKELTAQSGRLAELRKSFAKFENEANLTQAKLSAKTAAVEKKAERWKGVALSFICVAAVFFAASVIFLIFIAKKR